MSIFFMCVLGSGPFTGSQSLGDATTQLSLGSLSQDLQVFPKYVLYNKHLISCIFSILYKKVKVC